MGDKDITKGLIADVRPGAVDITGQQRELYPFDAFEYSSSLLGDENVLFLKAGWQLDITKGTLSGTPVTGTPVTEDAVHINTEVLNLPEIFATDIEITGTIQSNYVPGNSGFKIDGPSGRIDVVDGVFSGTIIAEAGSIAGWNINPTRLSSPNGKLRLDSEQVRTEVRDALGNVKIAIGYLEGIASYTALQYGIYIAAGNVLQIAGGGGFENGDYTIERDAAFVLDSGTEELIRLGSLDNGDLGLKIGDIDTGNGLFFSVEKGLTVRGKIVVQDIVIDDVDGISGLSADRQRRLEISSEKIDFYEVQDGVENKTASISDREDTRPVRFTKHIRVGNLAGELPVGTVAYYSCNGGVPIGAREGGEIDFTDEGAQIDGYAVSGARITNDMIVIGG